MNGTLFEIKSEYKSHNAAIGTMNDAEAKRTLLMLMRVVSSDHRFAQATRLAYMEQLLEDNRRLWCHA